MKRILLVLFIAALCSISSHPSATSPASSPARGVTLVRSAGHSHAAAVRHRRRCRHRSTVWRYARCITLKRWHSTAEWEAEAAIVTPESGWDPCAVFPSMHDCSYSGTNSCGVPQANPCPSSWRGRLWATRWAQCRWLIAYIAGRYGDPLAALAFRRSHGWY